MINYLKQAIVIIVCSAIVGIIFNFFRSEGIPFFAEKLSEYSNSSETGEFVIETIDIEIAKILFDEGVIFVDARDEISFIEGHIRGAQSVIEYEKMVDVIFNKQGFNSPIIVYCDDDECGLSEEMAYQLQSEGFSKIYVFGGGWNQWEKSELPTER